MKTPTSITGIPGRFLILLWLATSVFAETTALPTATSKSDSPPAPTLVGTPAKINLSPLSVPQLSPWAKEIVKLAQSAVDESVILTFIDNSGTFGMGADQIIYLNDIGVSSEVVNAMLQHDRELVSGERLPTVVSEAPLEPLIFQKSVPTGKAANEPSKPALAPTAQRVVPFVTQLPSQDRHAPTAAIQSTIEELDVMHCSATKPLVEKKQPLYPVRQPQAEEITPPIIFLNMPEVPPNTLIVYGFPKS